MSRERQQCQTWKNKTAKYQQKLQKTTEKFGCQRSTWIMLMGRQNYPKKQQNTVYSQKLGTFHVPLPIQERLLWAFGYHTVFQEHIDKVLEFKTPVRLDDIIYVTNGTIDEHEQEVLEVLNKLQNAEYRASEKNEIFKQELTWLGYHINQSGVKPIKDKTESITKLSAPKNPKELKSF